MLQFATILAHHSSSPSLESPTETGEVAKINEQLLKGAVSRNSAKLGNYKMPVKLT